MAQTIKQASIFGRIGTGIGKGLSEQIPKEIERNRLASGLQNFERDYKNLDPMQQLARLSAIPGISPQAIQSFSDLARQQSRAQAFSKRSGGVPGALNVPGEPGAQPVPIGQEIYNPYAETQQTQAPKQTNKQFVPPSITKGSIVSDLQKGYAPPTIEERDAIAAEAFNQNPAYFNNDPREAIAWADEKAKMDRDIFETKQKQNNLQSNIQDNLVNRLDAQSKRLNTKIPAELFTKFEDQAINAVKPKDEGGEGLTEHQAAKKYADKMNDASRIFEKINEIGNWEVLTRKSDETLRSIKTLQDEFEKIGETDNFAKYLIKDSGFSPMMAYSAAEPVYKVPRLNNFMKDIPQETDIRPKFVDFHTTKLSRKLAGYLKDYPQASPLAIARELQKKGYNPQVFLKFVTDNAKDLDLSARKIEQASTPINTAIPLNDWWLSSFSGID